MAITRGARIRCGAIPQPPLTHHPPLTLIASRSCLPSNADQYDGILQVFAQADSLALNSGVFFRVPVPSFHRRQSSVLVACGWRRTLQPDFLFSNNRQVQLGVRLQSGVYQVRATSNQSGTTFRPRTA